MTATPEEYINAHPKWSRELRELREIILATELVETIKWGIPVYTFKGRNVVGIAAFKEHCALWFYQGALLKENTALLTNAQEGKTVALRQIKFHEDDEIDEKALRNYILEAIQNEREGKKTTRQVDKKVEIPPELKNILKEDPVLLKAFKILSPGKQREYSQYIIEAKQAKTKERRIDKIIPLIMGHQGLNDRYKK